MIQDINTSIGTFDVSGEDYLFMKNFVENAVYDDYDRLVQLCDALAMPTGFCLWKTVCRCDNPVWSASVYGGPVEKILQLKTFFEKKAGCSIYELLPGVVENSFRQEESHA